MPGASSGDSAPLLGHRQAGSGCGRTRSRASRSCGCIPAGGHAAAARSALFATLMASLMIHRHAGQAPPSGRPGRHGVGTPGRTIPRRKLLAMSLTNEKIAEIQTILQLLGKRVAS